MFVVGPDLPDFGVFAGPAGVKNYMGRLLEHWDRYRIEAEQIQAAGDTVLAHVHQYGTGRESGVDVEGSFFMLFTFRGRRIVRIESVSDERAALEAVGLSEQDAHADS